ncbi:MAG: hypothetical protein J5669_04680 [Bacteroidales bacterium]|nr:hypothetical protein [Bacteroidales bacterium]
MNEHIDIILTTAKLATRNNQVAHLTTQAISMSYNATMLWHYNYQLALAQAIGPGYMSAEQIQAMKLDRIKHTVLLTLECVGVIAAGVCALQSRR